VLNQPTIVGTCTTCHDTPNIGTNSLGNQFNTSVAEATGNVGSNNPFSVCTFTNNATGEVIAVADPGLGLLTGKWADIGKFKVPSLCGMAARAPFFHNGMGTATLRVLQLYDKRFNIGFTTQDQTDLVNFLNAL
jgi:cytochrome c peroxidase